MFAQRLFRIFVFVFAIAGLASCSSVDTEDADLDSSYAPAESIETAVERMLNAEQKRDRNASFALLTPDARTQYKDVADWTTRRDQLPDVKGFVLGEADGNKQIATVDHIAALDPFKGLSPAKETQVWVGHKYEEGWLLEPDPASNPVLPRDEKAIEAVVAWTRAVQACDQKAAEQLQAVSVLLATKAPTLCGSTGEVITGVAGALPESADSAQVIEQYSTDAFAWAKTVPVTSPVPFTAILAPLGEEWKVLGLY